MSLRSKAVKITLQGIKQINLSFCPFDRYAGTYELREYYNNVTHPTVTKTNPDCKINMSVKNDESEPIINLHFLDGDERTYYPRTMSLPFISRDIGLLTKQKLDEQGTEPFFGVKYRY